MVEYATTIFKHFSFSSGTVTPEVMASFCFGGIVLVVIGYWTKKWTGVIISVLAVLLLFNHYTGILNRIMG
jgi:hypothetical protein